MLAPMEGPQLTQEAVRAEIESWRKIYEAERAELERSDRVLQQLEAVKHGLQQRCDELEAEAAKLLASARTDEACEALELELQAEAKACEDLEAQEAQLAAEAATAERGAEQHEERAASTLEARARELAAAEAHEREEELAEAQCAEVTKQARSLVSAEALHRAAEEAERLQGTVVEQEAEAARLRQALVDSWAARADDPLDMITADGAAGCQASAELQNLDDVEEELRWLAEAQQNAAAEVRHLQHLERSEAALQAKLRSLAEEKASLQSARVDLGGAGAAMREAVAVQSETYIRRVGALEDERRGLETDRKKLLQECADMQARVEAAAPELVEAEALEEEHRELNGQVGELSDESQRLRDVNAALGALLLGDDGASMADARAVGLGEELAQAVQLLRRAVERAEAQEEEKDRLADRIRNLEREAAQGGSAATPAREAPPAPARSGSRQAAPPAGIIGSGIASAGSVLRGGLGRLRDAALDAL